ncbi:hypothetical protein EP073_12540 [Geovibrio thiophilus]|uniref:VCBS repeat-containing protein n=1 Tax=Geovibrio thiophilus TaxID=139438 RepID=A0A3R5X4G2_9BACT|nr:hypothetical protein [Geovibrio thiophilus]QAR34202.1 hypothetical protein EP073_12540 [Geovibrio thiophilus]
MKKLLVLILILLPLAAQARFEKVASDVNSLFSRMGGYVVSVDGSVIYSDLGSASNVYPGLVLKVYKESEEIIHPITKQVLGRKKVLIGDAVVKNVFEGYSELELSDKKAEPRVGDAIVLNPPVEVAFKAVNVPTRIELLLKEDVAKVPNVILKDSAVIALNFTQDDKGGISLEARDTKTGTLIASAYYADIEAEDTGKLTRDSFQSDILEAEYDTMTVGHMIDKEEIYTAVSSKAQVDFYKFTGKAFEKKAELKPEGIRFIVSVDSADLDGNGIEEVLVSWLEYDKFAKTNVYEYDGAKFALKAEKLPFFSRVSYDKGKKVVLTQRLATDGTFVGQIQKLEYKGSYVRGESIPDSANKKLFGFGYADVNRDGSVNPVYINDDYKVVVEKDGEEVFQSVEQFSQTPKFINLQEEQENRKVNQKIKDIDAFEVMEQRQHLKGRIFVNTDGRLYLIKNQSMSNMLPNTFSYKGSAFAVYGWEGRTMSKVWESDLKEPVIVDYYMYEEYGRTYLFMLRNIAGGVFRKATSQIEYIETK